ncbi:DUF551 domain-containing protein [Enterobacter roggenkampii]|jgi:hypothetical protein|uniref:DUF551 domain-containing protein n=1 Tax=Enterobacter roggenkampii TaxID=1812935 RepID=UPI002005DEAB|nr:DUF551 domain-containing protein [Enterobacter roggenkampii]ELN9581054.1 DUF551 domain-containing protein [Enterobacter roggenkampii]MCK6717797.1 DUF551 domain-containing protein [Enterobacter roggenkampii]MDH1654764.1 DUF551 domain-containing protein [Enterobacter roggenkampii]
MSNIDKEWLQQKIADMEAARDEIPFGLGEDDSNTLAALRIALASLEAEPVSVFKIDHESSLIKHVKRVVSETNAQPAPVSVPAAMEMDDDFDSAFEHGKAVGWNAYRAAMLQSFGNSEQLNSPVIPDGWVACSERMPPPKAGVIVGCWFGRNWATKWATYLPYHPDAHQSGFLMPGGSWTPTHWMPLPAAPQQEVK